MRIQFDIDTSDTLSEHDKVVLLALAGEISLSEASEPRERPDYPVAKAHTPSVEGEAAIERDTAAREAADEAFLTSPEVQEAMAAGKSEPEAEEPKKRARVVNVSDASLEKYDFHRTDDGEIACNHCEYVSETGRALHLHAGTHTSDEAAPKEKALKSVPAPKEPEAGVDAFLGSEKDEPKVTEVEKATAVANDYTEPVAEVPEPIEAKVVETDPKVLREQVAKVATEMVADQRQAEIREVLNEVLGGVARVSMIAEKDLQKFLDAEPIAAFIAAQNKKG